MRDWLIVGGAAAVMLAILLGAAVGTGALDGFALVERGRDWVGVAGARTRYYSDTDSTRATLRIPSGAIGYLRCDSADGGGARKETYSAGAEAARTARTLEIFERGEWRCGGFTASDRLEWEARMRALDSQGRDQ